MGINGEKDFRKLLLHPLFENVPEELLLRVFSETGAEIREYASGELMRSPEEKLPVAGIILSGRATVTTPDPMRSTLLRFLASGDVFGIANLFSGEPFVSKITADSACRCACLPEKTIGELLERSGEFRMHYIGFLTGRIRFLNRKIGYLTAGSAERRLALYLSTLGSGEVILKDSITSLSDLLNLGRASLYRAFDRLQEDGHLIRDGRKLILPDPEAMLRAYQ